MKQRDAIVDEVIALLPAVAVALVKSGWAHDLVADAAQDVMLRILQSEDVRDKLATLAPVDLRRYLIAAVRNRLRDFLRQGSRVSSLAGLAREPVAPETDVHASIDLVDAIRRIPRPYREVINALLLKGCSAREIARKLNRKLPAVYQQIHRGLEKLKPVLLSSDRPADTKSS